MQPQVSSKVSPPKVLPHLPSLISLYGKAIMKQRQEHISHLPALAVTVPEVKVNSRQAQSYDQLCHFPESPYLSPTYLHVMAFPLHIHLVTDPSVPLGPLGLVHTGNRLRQFRPVRREEVLHVTCCFGASRQLDMGLSFDVETHIDASGERVFEGVSTYLCRDPSATRSRGARKKKTSVDMPDQLQTWQLAADLGRQYGSISGDCNPIHLWPVTARMFGFQRPIIHGMWSKARCLAALMSKIGEQPFTMEVEFKTPIFLPSTVEFRYSTAAETTDFVLCSSRGRAHLSGRLQRG